MVKVIWTDLAIDDLKSIYNFIAKDSQFYATRYTEKLISKVDQLQYYPEIGRKVPEFNNKSIKEILEGKYRIVYKINPEYIAILRVHHSAKLLKSV